MNVADKKKARIIAIVPAAGIGKRMGSNTPKQYLLIDGKTVLEHTLEQLLRVAAIDKIILVLAAQDKNWKQIELIDNPRIETVMGGQERSHSVLNGAEHAHSITAPEKWGEVWLMVHDVARPCVSLKDINKLIAAVVGSSVGGILAVPATDTMKEVSDVLAITKTIDRNQLWRAQTPQLFRAELLMQSLRNGISQGLKITDESSALELAGFQPLVIEGSERNIKITHADDLALASFYLTNGVM